MQQSQRTGRKTLAELKAGQKGCVYSVDAADPRIKRRIVDMGITPGIEIEVVKLAPMGDPIELSLRGYELSLRRDEALRIELVRDDEQKKLQRELALTERERSHRGRELLEEMHHENDADIGEHERAAMLTEFILDDPTGGLEEAPFTKIQGIDNEPVRLALVGNPNSGKTTLFNAMTGSREYVGNWPGVTVEKKEGKVKSKLNGFKEGLNTHGHEMTLVDLPGIYSLSPHSMEELIARNFILEEKPDAIIDIVDGTNLERNLYLTVQLMELERPMIIALNMMDEVQKNGDEIDCKRLSLELGIPVVPISARTGEGVNELVENAQKLLSAVHIEMHEGFRIEPDDVYDDMTHIEHHRIGALVEQYAKQAGLPLHWTEIKLLEGDEIVIKTLDLPAHIKKQVDTIVKSYAVSSPLGDNETMIADSRYRYIEKVCAAALKRAPRKAGGNRSSKIDKVLTNKYLALPIFLSIMLLIFTFTFSTVGAWLSDGLGLIIDEGVAPYVRAALEAAGAGAWFVSLICDGIIKGVGSVLAFLPQITLLFLCLSILEDSGYMSRIAFIMDKPMRRFGLSGKSFIPLLMGFGCTVPASMGARTMENMKDKRMTILLVPFMSCSAKLPVYGLLAGAFFAKGSVLVIFGLYFLGIVLGILSGLLFKNTVFKGKDAPFLIELPPYRMPTIKNTALHVGERVGHFLEKAGTIILAMSVLLWFLQSFDLGFNMVETPANSILGKLGTLIAPAFRPMGLGSWQVAVALITGLVAKEAVVSALAMFYGFSAAAGDAVIRTALSSTFSPRSAIAFLVFVLLYPPCIAAMTTMRRELESPAYTALGITYQVAVAYVASFAVYAIGGLFV
ncbi:MAG TPA: ferrous iron transport protein B [Clostridia bacterium]|nr:ferrous iron transport protein B [Clostridia bacterium]